MSDDWSLKDKKVTTWETNNVNDMWYTYKDTDIETLRKKLIDDIEQICRDEKYEELGHMDYSLKRIINKRFGIEE